MAPPLFDKETKLSRMNFQDIYHFMVRFLGRIKPVDTAVSVGLFEDEDAYICMRGKVGTTFSCVFQPRRRPCQRAIEPELTIGNLGKLIV